MGRSQETSNKKEVRTRKEKKRKEKEQKRIKKKSEGKTSFNDMIAYVDEFGKITSTPPDLNNKIEIAAENIDLSAKKNSHSTPDFVQKGIVVTFNDSKGYGFIRDTKSGQSIFVHATNILEPIKEKDIVSFETGKGPKGLTAMKVKLFKE
jgi:cold shock CspA family protein